MSFGPAPTPLEHTVDVRGLALHVVEWPSAGPTVVLHHGFLDHARSWDPEARILSQHLRVLAIDARGHGDSGWVGAGGYYYFQDYVFDLDDVIGTLTDGAPVRLVGHSMGCMVTALYAGTFPSRVAALVSIEGAGPPASDFESAPDRMREWIDGVRTIVPKAQRPMADVDAATTRLRAVNPALDEAFALHLAQHGTRPVDDGVLWKFDPLHRTRGPQPFYLDQARGFWEAIKAPTLRVRGGRTPFLWDPNERREEIVGARTVDIPDAGHMVHHEQPEALAAVLLEFLNTAT